MPLTYFTKLTALAISCISERNYQAFLECVLDGGHDTMGADVPDIVILKEYARYLVRSRAGRISEK